MKKMKVFKSSPHRWMIISLSSIVILSILLSGCQLPWQKAPETKPLSSETNESEPVPPATQQPRKDLPPALVEVLPIPGSVIGLQEPISLFFNQVMDTESVEAAIHFEPRVNGRFTWEGEQTLTFVPDQPLPAGINVRMAVDTTAQAGNKKKLQEPVAINFQTSENFLVSYLVPNDLALDVDPESIIFVSFNQPVVALSAETDYDPAFALVPEVPGNGEWLNTSTYIFTPDPSMAGGTQYMIQLNEDLTAASGTGLAPEQERGFRFTTTHPAVMNVLPKHEEFLRLDGPIEIQFNMRMDADSVQEKFQLLNPAGQRVRGVFEWAEDLKSFTFTPRSNLSRAETYTIQLDSGAQSFGGLPMQDGLRMSRTTFPGFSSDPIASPELETYYGDYGQYKVHFTTPVDPDSLEKHLSIEPEVNVQSLYTLDNGKTVILSGYYKPETSFTLTFDADLEDIWGDSLGQELTYSFSTPPAQPSLTVITGSTIHDLVFVPSTVSQFAIQATNINTLTLELSPIGISDLITLLHPDNYDYRELFLPDSLEVTTHNLNLSRNRGEVVLIPLSYQGNPLAPGVYFLGISSPDITDNGARFYEKLFLVVSENNVVMKTAPEQAFVWATHLGDNEPLVGASVSVYNTEGDLITSGQTDDDGIFTDEFSRFDDPYAHFFTLVGAPGEADFAFSISSWGLGYSYYESGITLDILPRQTEAYVYTDRPIYRPGDTIYFKAIVFSRENGIPVPSALESVNLAVYSDAGQSGISEKLFSEELALSQFGTVEGSVTLSEDAPAGYYRIEVMQGEEYLEVLYFDVAAYRKPEIELALSTTSPAITAGENLTVELQTDYYFGLPAAGLPFTWTLYRDDANFDLPGYQIGPQDTSWLMPFWADFSALGIYVSTGEGVTDPDGQAAITFTGDDMALTDVPNGSLQQYNLSVSLVDQSGFTVSGQSSFLVHPESFYIGVQPETYFGRAETAFDFSILTVNWDKAPAGQRALDVVFESIVWEVEKTQDPERPYRYVPITTFIGSASPVTDGEGRARVSFTPPVPGNYQISVRSGDAVTQATIWVSGAGSAVWPRQPQNKISLTADAEGYLPGQTAQIFFPNPFGEGATALITIERGQVMESQVLSVEGAGATLSLPVTEALLPNFYVSVILLGQDADGAPDYRQGLIKVPVSPESKRLNIDLVLDPNITQPGETVFGTMTITDQSGNPVQGEFSVAVVDKAVLPLMKAQSLPIDQAFYGNQPLSVQTSFSLRTFAAQLALSIMDLGRGGGGDMGEEPAGVREDFPDTALWEGVVVTGVDGTARLEIPLPDSLTTWVVDVRGLTEDYRVGRTEAEILTQKDLMIRPVTPRFLVAGDQVELAAIVHNNTQDALDVDVSLQGAGFSLFAETPQTQQVTIIAGGGARVTWWGTVESVESVELIFKAVSGALADASKPVWGDLEVKRFTVPYTFSTSGQLAEEGQRLELVSLPGSIVPSDGSLTVALTPSLTATLVEGIKAFDQSPHFADTVSTLSRFLAHLNAYIALKDLGMDVPQLQSELEDMVGEGIKALLDSQNVDGGWSWWAKLSWDESASAPFITAYVLMGLEAASDAGLDVSGYFIDRAVEYLAANLTPPGEIESAWRLDQLAFEVYALRKRTVPLDNHINGLFARRSELSPWAASLLGLAIREWDGSNSRVTTILMDLENSAIRSATGVHWESERPSWLLPGTPIFNTAVGVFAFAQLDPASTSLPLALRYLMTHRNAEGLWSSTFESSWALMAVTAALQGTGDYQADYTFNATLNDILIAEGAASGAVTLSGVVSETALEDMYANDPNALVIERGQGTGTLYYRADLETYQPAATADAVNRGINLDRVYTLAGEGCPDGENCSPLHSIKLNPDDPTQMITVTLTAVLSQDMYHFLLEDTIPAGTEILDQRLLTSPVPVEEPASPYDPLNPFKDGWGWWFFNDPQIYDDHILWTAEYLPAGTYVLRYTLLPYQSGVYQVIPARAWQYFYPEVQGTSAGNLFEIE